MHAIVVVKTLIIGLRRVAVIRHGDAPIDGVIGTILLRAKCIDDGQGACTPKRLSTIHKARRSRLQVV